MMVTIVIAALLLTVNAVAPVQAKRPLPPDYRVTGRLILGAPGAEPAATYDYELKGYKNGYVTVGGTLSVKMDALFWVDVSLEIWESFPSNDWSPNPSVRGFYRPDEGNYWVRLYSWDQRASQIKRYRVDVVLYGAVPLDFGVDWDSYFWYL